MLNLCRSYNININKKDPERKILDVLGFKSYHDNWQSASFRNFEIVLL
jgi:hypothetical protein